MPYADRILELRRVPASQLRPHPRNWRRHPPAQQAALRGILSEIGFAAALLVRQRDDGTLEILDGHLRADTAADTTVPVLVVDLSDAEADKLLATFDPIGAMAEADAGQLQALVAGLELESEAVQSMLADLLEQAQTDEKALDDVTRKEPVVGESYQVVVECGDETRQQELYDRLTADGYDCHVRIL